MDPLPFYPPHDVHSTDQHFLGFPGKLEEEPTPEVEEEL